MKIHRGFFILRSKQLLSGKLALRFGLRLLYLFLLFGIGKIGSVNLINLFKRRGQYVVRVGA